MSMEPLDTNDIEIVRDRLSEMFPDSRLVPGDVMRLEEEMARVSDWNRISEGKATPEEIQRENSPFTVEQAQTFRIANLEEVLTRLK